MPLSEPYANSQLVSTTEHSMPADAAYAIGSPQTADGWFQAFIDFNALAAGDTFEFRVYEKVGAASTQRLVYNFFVVGAQSQPVFVSPVLALMHGWDMTLKKIAGTDRTIDWSIRQA